MDINDFNLSLNSFSSRILELKEKLEQTNSDLNDRESIVSEKESILNTKEKHLSEKESFLNSESENLESFKKASIMNKIYKELDTLKNENKLLKQSFYKKDTNKTKVKNVDSSDYLNFMLKILGKDMEIVIQKCINLELSIDIDTKPVEKLNFGFLIQLRSDMDILIDKNKEYLSIEKKTERIKLKSVDYLSDGQYLYNLEGDPVGYKTQKGYKLYKKNKK